MTGMRSSRASGKAAVGEKNKKRKQDVRKNAIVASNKYYFSGEPTFRLQKGAHSYGVEPLGNLLVQTCPYNLRDFGLGNLRFLTDEILIDILGLLGARDLGRLALVSKAMYVFAHQDSLWRSLVLSEFHGKFSFRSSWKNTHTSCRYPNASWPTHFPLRVKNFYSDYFFQSWLCASLEMKSEWLSRDNIERRSNLSLDDFIVNFEELNRPVLISGAMADWPALEKWDRNYLLQHCKDVEFSAGPVDLKLEHFFTYADAVEEERPLYIFDSKFGEKAPQLARDYNVPVYFQEDLFAILGKDRPDYRWLILGPARSGSSFHIDPNSTSAWNAVVRGAKKWVLYPPETVPPGVHPSLDGAEVASPISIPEWFMNFYEETCRRKAKPIECICRTGEVVFVPNGWWHIVINLEDSIAITQNYVSRRNILNVLEFLNRPNSNELVSGTHDRVSLYKRFKKEYEKLFPGSIEDLQMKADEKKLEQGDSFWNSIADAKVGSFKFDFM